MLAILFIEYRFSGIALDIRIGRPRTQFVVAWRRHFGDPDFQYALRDEIFARKENQSLII